MIKVVKLKADSYQENSDSFQLNKREIKLLQR